MDIVMPQMGESLTEGSVTAWLKAPGEAVAKDEPLLEIETDKVDTVIDSPESGVLAEIFVQPGETVPVGTRLGRLTTSVDSVSHAPDRVPAVGGSARAHFGDDDRTQVILFSRRDGGTTGASSRRFSRAVLTAAREHGLEEADLPGLLATGRGGRLTVADVVKAARATVDERQNAGGRPAVAPGPVTPVPMGPHPAPMGAAPASPSGAPSRYLYTPAPRDQLVPMPPVRQRIADHMSWSRRISAHATAFDLIEVGQLARWLGDRKEEARAEERAPVTWTAAFAYVAVLCLDEFPLLNAAVVGDHIAMRPFVRLGIAVAVGDELLVPVISDGHLDDVHALAARLADLTARARSHRLQQAEVDGGTFTYSNPGVAGGLFGTPIINQPQVALLSTNAVRDRPWVVDGEVVARPVVGVSLSFDHRIVDGITGFQYIEKLRSLLSDPQQLARSRVVAKKSRPVLEPAEDTI